MRYSTADEVLQRVKDVVEFNGIELENINQRGIFGSTPLLIVVEWDEADGDVEAARLLIDAGADVNAIGEDGDTALHRAVCLGKLDLIKLLLISGAKKNLRNNNGLTAIDEAKRRRQLEVLSQLGATD